MGVGLEQLCVGFVICSLVLGISGGFSFFMTWINEDDPLYGFITAWLLMAVCFGISLTYILYMNGVI